LAVAKKFEGKPVAFIGVNSGNTRADVEAYVRQNRISWPVIVDSDRSLEQAAGVGQVSLQNIWQMALLTPDGRLVQGNSNDFEKAAENLAATAKWNVDPANIPAGLRPTWMSVEFGNYAAAASVIKRSLASAVPEQKAGAEQLNAYVQAQIAQAVDAARQADQAGQRWRAYQAYNAIVSQFAGYDLPADATGGAKRLAADEAVKAELEAAKDVESAKKLLGSTVAGNRKRGVKLLEAVVAEAPQTEAAREATALLQQANAGN
jgi:hypothetical protein